MLSSAWTLRSGDAEQIDESVELLSSIGRAFCLENQAPPAGVEGVWIWYYRNYDDGSVFRRNGLYFDYSCENARLGEVTWHPSDRVVLARWGSTPW
jgi:hypothetical protein